MTTNDDALDGQCLYITSKIKRFYDVRNIGDYLKVAANIRKSGPAGTSQDAMEGIIRRFRSWSRSEKLALAIALTGFIALVVTVLTLLITAGMLIL